MQNNSPTREFTKFEVWLDFVFYSRQKQANTGSTRFQAVFSVLSISPQRSETSNEGVGLHSRGAKLVKVTRAESSDAPPTSV